MYINGKTGPVDGLEMEGLGTFTEETCSGSLMLGNDNGNHFFSGQI